MAHSAELPSRNYKGLRAGLMTGSLVCLVLIAAGLSRYLSVTSTPGVHFAYGTAIILITSIPGVIGLAYSHPRRPSAILAIERGVPLGLVVGFIWTVQIIAVRLVLSVAERQSLGLALIAIAGIGTFLLSAGSAYLSSRRSGKIITSFQVGIWSGLISGLMAFLTVMILTYLLAASRLNEVQVMLAFQQSGESNPAAWFFWDQIGGATGYLALSAGLSIFSSLLGGLAGFIWYTPRLK